MSFSVVDWFKNIENKKNFVFIIFDVVNFQPSITLKLLENSIKWAETFVEISDKDKDTIIQSRKNFLVKNGEYWVKRKDEEFDVPMGAFDGAEVADIVGLFMLSELVKTNKKAVFTSYKDDGLAISDESPQEVEKIMKNNTFNKPY